MERMEKEAKETRVKKVGKGRTKTIENKSRLKMKNNWGRKK